MPALYDIVAGIGRALKLQELQPSGPNETEWREYGERLAARAAELVEERRIGWQRVDRLLRIIWLFKNYRNLIWQLTQKMRGIAPLLAELQPLLEDVHLSEPWPNGLPRDSRSLSELLDKLDVLDKEPAQM